MVSREWEWVSCPTSGNLPDMRFLDSLNYIFKQPRSYDFLSLHNDSVEDGNMLSVIFKLLVSPLSQISSKMRS